MEMTKNHNVINRQLKIDIYEHFSPEPNVLAICWRLEIRDPILD